MRLIDSMTKQVSFFISRRRGTSRAATFRGVEKLAAPEREGWDSNSQQRQGRPQTRLSAPPS